MKLQRSTLALAAVILIRVFQFPDNEPEIIKLIRDAIRKKWDDIDPVQLGSVVYIITIILGIAGHVVSLSEKLRIEKVKNALSRRPDIDYTRFTKRRKMNS